MTTGIEPVFGPEGPKTYHERVLAARRNMRRRADAPVEKTCLWTHTADEYDDDGLWNTCGDQWFLPEGTPSGNGMNYCPLCGGKLRERP
jgi:hypothetical protein